MSMRTVSSSSHRRALRSPRTGPPGRGLHEQKPATVTYRSQEFGLFVQDDFRLGNRMRVMLASATTSI